LDLIYILDNVKNLSEPNLFSGWALDGPCQAANAVSCRNVTSSITLRLRSESGRPLQRTPASRRCRKRVSRSGQAGVALARFGVEKPPALRPGALELQQIHAASKPQLVIAADVVPPFRPAPAA
jgi:hypothetical protein